MIGCFLLLIGRWDCRRVVGEELVVVVIGKFLVISLWGLRVRMKFL